MSGLTRRQHYVPRVYLGRWAPDKTNLLVTDKESGDSKQMSIRDSMVQSWYYENPNEERNNELERAFHEYEGPFGSVMNLWDFVLGNTAQLQQDPVETMTSMLTALEARREQLARFAATLYFRTPGALEAKRREVQAASTSLPGLGAAVRNAYEFNKEGFNSTIIARLMAMRLSLIHSATGFITSDRPCFDLERRLARVPRLGDEIGVHEDVVCLMPLTPQWLALFIPIHSEGGGESVRGIRLDAPQTQAFNELIRENAHRWIVELP